MKIKAKDVETAIEMAEDNVKERDVEASVARNVMFETTHKATEARMELATLKRWLEVGQKYGLITLE